MAEASIGRMADIMPVSRGRQQAEPLPEPSTKKRHAGRPSRGRPRVHRARRCRGRSRRRRRPPRAGRRGRCGSCRRPSAPPRAQLQQRAATRGWRRLCGAAPGAAVHPVSHAHSTTSRSGSAESSGSAAIGRCRRRRRAPPSRRTGHGSPRTTDGTSCWPMSRWRAPRPAAGRRSACCRPRRAGRGGGASGLGGALGTVWKHRSSSGHRRARAGLVDARLVGRAAPCRARPRRSGRGARRGRRTRCSPSTCLHRRHHHHVRGRARLADDRDRHRRPARRHVETLEARDCEAFAATRHRRAQRGRPDRRAGGRGRGVLGHVFPGDGTSAIRSTVADETVVRAWT